MKIIPTLTWRIWLLIIIILLSFLAIFGFPPTFTQKGIIITSVEPNTTAFNEGLRTGQKIISVDGIPINTLEDYTKIILDKFPSDEKQKITIGTSDAQFILFTEAAPEITISNIPKTNIKTGLDLTGGSRAIVQAKDKKLTTSEVNDLVDITRNRINVYGISDVKVVPISDLEGNHFMLVEVAGATPQDLKNLISQQGKFEAKIGNDTVFIGGNKDIQSVCSSPQCSGIRSCDRTTENTYACNFFFSIFLSEEAASRHATITGKLGRNSNSTLQGRYLDKNLDLYLDGKLVDSLLISEDLKGSTTQQIQISGSGNGANQADAFDDAESSMKNLQTVLKTGSLPFELEIVKLDTVSPTLGSEFIKIILYASLAAIVVVFLVIFVRYRNLKASIALLITSICEIIIILGIAALLSWNLDLPSIAGIIATIGTGIDDLVILIDESKHSRNLSLKQRMKRAFAIILAAYFTSALSLLPLWWAGAGLLKGFVFTTLIGITSGVLITRPAFADFLKRTENKL